MDECQHDFQRGGSLAHLHRTAAIFTPYLSAPSIALRVPYQTRPLNTPRGQPPTHPAAVNSPAAVTDKSHLLLDDAGE